MSEPSSKARPYNSPRRTQHANQTRQDILSTARDLFVTHGYGLVTMSDIARVAGVAVKTVYTSVGTKSEVLHELLIGDVEESRNSGTHDEIQNAPDLRSAVTAIAAVVRADTERYSDSINLLHSAMASDDGARRIGERIVSAYRGDLRKRAERLIAADMTAPSLDVNAVSDRLWFCFGLNAWRTLVGDCGWSFADAEGWLSDQCFLMLSDWRPSGS
ncbi:TetR/AcrR family transcriptional regulator [Streptomyces olivaceus]|uniref:TetR/AcrR family transcriptional regulator n=1 Tax=Streptomyces olivaceus TaxID=47716 RepID=UPI0040572A41